MISDNNLEHVDGRTGRKGVSSFGGQPKPTAGLRAATAVARDRGVSDVTLWRQEQRGWFKTVNICGKKYVDLKSLAEFDRRAVAGEFAKPPSGAARASAEARAEKENAAKMNHAALVAKARDFLAKKWAQENKP